MAGYYTTRGYVLRRFNLGEADRIITFITPDQGKLKAVARGVRRMKSKLAGHLELFSHVDLHVAAGKRLDVITSVKLLEAPPQYDYEQLASAYVYAEMLDKLLDEGETSPDVYVLVEMTFSDLGRGATSLNELYFKLRLAGILGYEPEVSRCARCGGKDAEAAYFFEPSLGGIVDDACRTVGALAITRDGIKLWRAILSLSLANVRRIAGAEALAAETLPICNAFYEYNFDRRFTAAETMQGTL